MNADARFARWLTATRSALSAPDDARAEALSLLVSQRDELVRSMADDPPDTPPTELASELLVAERALAKLVEGARSALGDRLAELRTTRRAVHGYRPALANRPTRVSRSV